MKMNEWKMYQAIGAFQRLQIQDIKGPVRYAVTRTLQILLPLYQATLEAFPEPKDPKEREAWVKTLESREVEFTPTLIPYPPDVDDQVYVMEQKAVRKAATEGPDKDLTDEQIEINRIVRNQSIMDAILPFIKEPVEA